MVNLPEPTRKRLVSLWQLLSQKTQDQSFQAKENIITSREISTITGWTDATIRRDISTLGIKCKSSNGYDINKLQQEIQSALFPITTQEKIKCCIVGLDPIGAAFIEYSGFEKTGFLLVAGFDERINRVETLNAPFPLYPASKLEQIIQMEKIFYGILSVPEENANFYVSRLVEVGIKGIVNCTSAVLTVPANVAVENISVTVALQNLLAKDLA